MSIHDVAVRANRYLPNPRDISATRIIMEAERAGVLPSDAFALIEGESGFRNVFGHDGGGMYAGQRVTAVKARLLLDAVRHGHVSNGVGVTQLTSEGLLEQAMNLGGLHIPRLQARVGFEFLASLQKNYGRREGFRHFNGSGPTAKAYADRMMARSAVWHERLK